MDSSSGRLVRYFNFKRQPFVQYDLPKIGKLADDSNAALQNSWQGLAYPSRKNKNLLSKNVNSPKDDPTASKRKLGPSLDGLDAQIESGKIII